MKKHAFLILFHDKLPLAEKLVSCLDHERSVFVLHCDKKRRLSDAERTSLAAAAKKGRVVFAPSVPVNWGGYSQIRAELAVFRAALGTGEDFCHLHLLSGSDLPLKPVGEILAFFDSNEGKEFVRFEDLTPEVRERFSFFHPFQERLRRSAIARFAEKCAIHIQKKSGRDRVKNDPRPFGFGSNWVSITPGFAQELLSREKEIRRLFSRTQCCDEVFVQTLILGTPFEKALYRPASYRGAESNVRLVDWERGDPYVFREEDLPSLFASPCLFARKFDPALSGGAIEALCRNNCL